MKLIKIGLAVGLLVLGGFWQGFNGISCGGFRGTLGDRVSVLGLGGCPAWALEPDEVMVVANRNAAKSAGLAAFYMNRRKIPQENLLLLWISDKETCSRQEYEKKALVPVKRPMISRCGRPILFIWDMGTGTFLFCLSMHIILP